MVPDTFSVPNVNLPDGRTITKKTPFNQIKEIIKQAKDLGLNPKQIKDLKGLAKVVGRGGTLGILLDLMLPDEVNAAEDDLLRECLASPGACGPKKDSKSDQ